MDEKKEIIELFFKNVKGRKPNIDGMNIKHDGKYGHWLERQFGIVANRNNAPDLYGYELKSQTASKTSFGDWSANEYIYKSSQYREFFQGKTDSEKRNSFIRIFGKSNLKKNGRYSWSGSPCPKINVYNAFGQRLEITNTKDIVAVYSYSFDMRGDKSTIVPEALQNENLVIAKWYGLSLPKANRKQKCLKYRVEDKFNQKGWFTCKMDNTGAYSQICFGKPMSYDNWINLVSEGIVFFDSGMYEGNSRNYSQWRANNNFWDSLIIEIYE